jgi:hypothetical protein
VALLYTPFTETETVTCKGILEVAKEAVAVGLWSSLFVFAIMVGLIVHEGIVRF